MRITLIQTPCYELNDDRLEPNLGLLYLATYLNQHWHDACMVDLSSVPNSQWEQLIPFAEAYGFSTYSTTYHRTLEVQRVAKSINPKAVTVAGGPHASALPQEVAQDFDFVVVGEGERALLGLLSDLEEGEQLAKIVREQLIEDLDEISFPDYSLVALRTYHRIVAGKPSVSILSSRGCPYQCNFCNSIIMGRNRKVRFRSPGNIAEEIQQVQARYGIRSFRFQDDIFTLSVQRIREITRLLKPLNIVYRCFGRVNTCTQEMAELLYEGGCRHIAFGVESGSQQILDLMNKAQTVEQIRTGIANAKAAGLVVRVFLIVGCPGETWEAVQQTVDLMLECSPHEYIVYPLIPYPGTPLYHFPERFGITQINRDFSQYFQVRGNKETGFVFRTKELDEVKIAEMRAYVIEQLAPYMTWAGESKEFK